MDEVHKRDETFHYYMALFGASVLGLVGLSCIVSVFYVLYYAW